MSNKLSTSFSLTKLSAISLLSGDEKDLRAVAIEVSVYESVLKNSVQIELLLSDSLNLFSNFPFFGYELLDVSFKNDVDDVVYSKVFRVSSIRKVEMVRERTVSYILAGVSEPDFTNETADLVSKSFHNTRISDMAANIASEYLGIQFTTLDPTTGFYSYTIPFYDPFTALNFLANRAISDTYKGALYFCYENRDGHSFRSLESAMMQPIKQVFLLQPANIRDLFGGIEDTDIISIQDYEFVSANDILNSIALGMYGSSILLHSISRKKYFVKTFDYNERYKDFIHVEPAVKGGKLTKLGGTDISSPTSFYRMLPGEPYEYENKVFTAVRTELVEGERRKLPSKLDENQRNGFPEELSKIPRNLMSVRKSRVSVQETVPVLSFNLSPKLSQVRHEPVMDLTRDRHELAVLERQSQRTALMNNVSVRLTVPGTASCIAGDMIELRLPSPEPVVPEKPLKLDPHYSGRYLVVSARHFISQKDNAYFTAYECVKDAVVTPFPDA